MVKKVDTIFKRAPRFVVREARMVVYNVNFQKHAGIGLGTIVLLAFFCLSIFGSSFFDTKTAEAANTCTWTGAVNSNWSNAGNWSGCSGVAPTSADTVSFTSGSAASTVDTTYTVAAVTVNGYTGTITLGANLTVSGAYSQSTGTVASGSYTVIVQGLATISGGSLTCTTGTKTFSGGLTISGGTFTGSTSSVSIYSAMTLSSGILNATTGTFNVYGNWTKTGGTFNPSTGTVNFAATSGTQSLNSGGSSFYDIRVPGGTSTATLLLASDLHCTDQIWVSRGIFDANGYNINSDANMGLDGGTWYARTGTTTVGGPFYVYSYYSTANFTAATGAINISGDLSLYQYLGTGKVNGTFIAPSSTLTIGGSLAVSGTFTNNGGTVLFNTAAAGKTLSGTMTGVNSFNNLTFNGGGSWGFSNAVNVAAALTITSGTVSTNSNALSYGTDFTLGDSTHNGVLNAGSSTITMSGGGRGIWVQSAGSGINGTDTLVLSAASGNQWLYSVTGALSLYNISHTGGGTAQPFSTSLTLGGTLTNSAGTFDANGSAHTFTGLATVSGGTYSASTAAQNFNGGLTISGGTFTSSSGTVTVNGVFTLSSGTFTQATSTLNVSGNFAISNGANFTKATGGQALIFNGTGSISDLNTTLQDLGVVSITNNATRTQASNIKMTSLAIASGSVYDLAGYNFSFSATAAVSNSGTFRLEGVETLTNVSNLGITAGTVVYYGRGLVETLSPTYSGAPSSYYNLTINATNTTFANMSLNVSGTFLISAGTFYANASSTITGLTTVNGGSYSINGPNTNTFNGGLTISSGTFTGSTGAVNITGDLNISSGTFTAPSGNLTITGNFTNNGTFTHNSGTVVFNGISTLAGSATPPAFAATFNNLTVNAGKTIKFTNGEYFKIIGAFNLSGTSGFHVTVNSSDNTNQWFLNYQPGSASIAYADVSNSGCDSTNSPATANLNLDATNTNVTNDGYCWFAPYLSFSMNSNAIAFNNLNNADNYTDTQAVTFTTSTNAKHGYVIQGFMSDFLRALADPTQTISDFPGTWATPALWGNTCNVGGASYCGFGYTSSDTSVQGSNRFAGGTAYAAYSQTGPGDVLADHGDISSEVKNEQFTITNKVSVPATQAASKYQATLTVIVTAKY